MKDEYINRQAAIDALHTRFKDGFNEDKWWNSTHVLAAIEGLPSAQPDGIPLEWIDKHLEWLDNCDNDFAQLAKVSIKAMVELWKNDRIIADLPSVQPERKMGKWIYNSPVTMKCDQCGFVIKDWDWHRFKFCPNCDCDMRGEQDG